MIHISPAPAYRFAYDLQPWSADEQAAVRAVMAPMTLTRPAPGYATWTFWRTPAGFAAQRTSWEMQRLHAVSITAFVANIAAELATPA